MRKMLSLMLVFLLCFSCSAVGELEVSEGNKGDSAESVRSQSYADLAVTGSMVWQVMDGEIRGTDVHSRQIEARMPLSMLYEEREDFLALTAFGGKIWLCAAWNTGNPSCRVTLFELQPGKGDISPNSTTDASGTLGFLFDGRADWKEISMVACGQGIYIAAMDADWNYEMFVYRQETGELLSIGSQPLSGYSAVFPMGDGLLLSGTDENDQGTEILIRINLPGGERETLGSVQTGFFAQPSAYAYNEGKQMLYYFLNGTGYRAAIGPEARPEAFCSVPENAAWLRYGAVAEGVYVMLDTEGELIFRDTSATLTAETFRILDLTGAEALADAVGDYNAKYPDSLLVLSSGDDEEEVLNAVLSQSVDYDAFSVTLGSDLYRTMRARGYLGSLAGSEILEAAAAAMPEQIRKAVWDGDRLIAFPVAVTNSVLALKIPAFKELTGMDEEGLPTDWAGFLSLLNRIAEQGLPEDGRYVLLDEGLSARTIQGTFFSWIMQDMMLWLSQDEMRLSSVKTVLLPVLQAFEQIPWEVYSREGNGNWSGEEETSPLVLLTEPEIAVMALDPGMAYWPLSLAENGERWTGQEVDALILNPYSGHADTIIRYLETVWQQMDIVTRMELDPSVREPVVNQGFEEDMAFLDQQISLYEEAVQASEDGQEAAELRAELAELKQFAEGYRENAAWIVSESSIALYRTLEPMLALTAEEFWSEGAEDVPVFQFLDGMLPAAQFVDQLASAMLMSQIEGR